MTSLANAATMTSYDATRNTQARVTTPEIWSTRDATWLSRQEIACTLVRMHCSHLARAHLESGGEEGAPIQERVHLYLDALGKHFRSSLLQSDALYHDLKLSSCMGVSDYAAKPHQARCNLEKLDQDIKISEPLFISRFLEGLGLSYSIFLLSFYRLDSLLPTRDETGAITRPGVTFSEVVIQAERAEANIKLQNQPTVSVIVRK